MLKQLEPGTQAAVRRRLVPAIITLAAWLVAFLAVMVLLTVFDKQLASLSVALRALVISGVLVVVMVNVVMPVLSTVIVRLLADPADRSTSGEPGTDRAIRIDGDQRRSGLGDSVGHPADPDERGQSSFGLARGWAAYPVHPPLTHVTIGAYTSACASATTPPLVRSSNPSIQPVSAGVGRDEQRSCGSPREAEMHVQAQSDSPRNRRGDGQVSYLLLAPGQFGSCRMAITLVEGGPGSQQALHSHPQSEQVYVIVSGGRMIVSDEQRDVEAGSLVHLPLADQSVDLIVSSFSLHHWDNPQAAVPELARVLRPGGRVYIYDFRAAPFDTLIRVAQAHSVLDGQPPQRTPFRTGTPLLPRSVRLVMSS
jgi:mannose-6-phosphate isomerase-like protein (cupin superfamily)